ncbi:MAG: hypothetical protein H0X51_07635 [Parachlamydiaceae bacterium]|nr:hypothetical protein [Parachlamydiaceae bacterium]
MDPSSHKQHFDITQIELRESDFKEKALEVEKHGKSEHLVWRKLNSEERKEMASQSGLGKYFGKVFSGIADAFVTDETGFKAVAKLVDKEASQKLEEFEKERKSWQSLPPKEQIKRAQEQLKHIRIIEQNLSVHNVIIKEFNGRTFTKLGNCDEHKLGQARGQAFQVERIISQAEKQLKAEAEEKIKGVGQLLAQVEQNVRYGQAIDREFIAESYPAFLNKVEEIRHISPAQANEFEERYNIAVNRGYLKTMISQVEGRQLTFPISYQIMLVQMGISHDEIGKQMGAGVELFLKHLHSCLNDEKLLKGSPQKLVDTVQNVSLEIIGKALKLTPAQHDNLKQVLKAIYDFELTEGKALRELLMSSLTDATEEERELKGMLKNLPMNLVIQRVLPNLYSKANLEKANLKLGMEAFNFSKEEMTKFLGELNAFQKNYHLYVDELKIIEKILSSLSYYSKETNVRKSEWMRDNLRHQSLSFNQGVYGDDAVLGGGCCAGIVFGWGLEIQKNPDKKITSLADVNPVVAKAAHKALSSLPEMRETVGKSSFVQAAKREARRRETEEETKESKEEWELSDKKPTEELSESGVTGVDRYRQAAYSVAVRMGDVNAIPESVLKHEGVKRTSLIQSQARMSSKQFLEKLNQMNAEKDGKLFDSSSGMVQIGIYDFENGSGHAIAVQMREGTYRILDPNLGIFTYKSLEHMQTEFVKFMQAFYPKYQCTRAYQYSKG